MAINKSQGRNTERRVGIYLTIRPTSFYSWITVHYMLLYLSPEFGVQVMSKLKLLMVQSKDHQIADLEHPRFTKNVVQRRGATFQITCVSPVRDKFQLLLLTTIILIFHSRY